MKNHEDCAKFVGLDPRRYEGIKRIVASEIGLSETSWDV